MERDLIKASNSTCFFVFIIFQNACRVVHLLLEHQANPNLLCNGFSGLALSIASGNDLVREQW